MSKNQRKLRNFIINPKFQMKYIFWVTMGGLTVMTGYAFIFYYFVKENYMILVDMADMTKEAKDLLYHELHVIILLLIAFSVLFLIITTIIGIVFSHRVAGPLYKLNLVISKIKEGNTDERCHFRPNDEFREIANNFNEMLNSIIKK